MMWIEGGAWLRIAWKPGAAALILIACAPIAALGQADPGCVAWDDCLPPQGADYASEYFGYPGGLAILGPVCDLFSRCDPPPKRGESTVRRFTCRFRGTLMSRDGLRERLVDGQVPVTVRVSWNGRESGGVRVFDTELLGMDVAGEVGGISVMIRESPTVASTGLTRIERVPDGGFAIQSFFDAYTEMSLDGGQTWTPAQGPARMSACQLH